MAAETEHTRELQERARVHDVSKFGPDERVPYIWMQALRLPPSEGCALHGRCYQRIASQRGNRGFGQ